MNGALHHHWLAISIRATIAEDVLEQHYPVSPQVVGEEVARQVQRYVQREKLGYYPALELFQRQGDVDRELLVTVDSLAWLVTQLGRREIQRSLRPVFASLKIDSVQCTAYTLPAVRLGQLNAHLQLGRHYAPDSIQLGLKVDLIQKRAEPENLGAYTRNLVHRWLRDRFQAVDVSGARLM